MPSLHKHIMIKIRNKHVAKNSIGLAALTALVISSMIGSGIFSLPQNMAAVAGSQAFAVGWLITGVGIIFPRLCHFRPCPNLSPNWMAVFIRTPATASGDLMGFFSAWGYWLCTTVGIVGYLVVAFEASRRICRYAGQRDFRQRQHICCFCWRISNCVADLLVGGARY